MLLIFLVSLLAVSTVSAVDNATDDVVSVSEDNEAVSVDNNDEALNSTESEVLQVDESNEDHILQSSINNTVEVLSANNASVNSEVVLGAVNPGSPEAEPVLKSSNIKIVKMKVKYKWTTKKIGKYKIKARLWKVRYAYGYTNYLDIILYKNGKQLQCGKYLSKYKFKDNGRWRWWPTWRHGGVNHAYHRYINDYPISLFKVKFRY